MFTLPPPSQPELHDSLMLVHLCDDPNEIATFLATLYFGCMFSPLCLDFGTPEELASFHGLLRVATKYQVTSIQEPIVKYLEQTFPVSWDTAIRPTGIKLLTAPHLASVIDLARIGHVPQIICFCFYLVAFGTECLPCAAIRQGLEATNIDRVCSRKDAMTHHVQGFLTKKLTAHVRCEWKNRTNQGPCKLPFM
ncbi:hypothetical protein K439DRAFT_1622796 [Ramaria rubella]|nr:hypothetical protein K439DRAFT_1622796 [Ramaria rubella]